MNSGETRLAGVMGWPVAHSKSPRLHGFWLRQLNVDGAYLPLSVAPEKLLDAVTGLTALGFRGVNLTIPHKEAVMPLCDQLDETARRIGAVNTIVVAKDGALQGTNTDACGFIENLRQNSSWTAAAGAAVLLGAGGAARAIAVALSDAGVRELRIVNRTVERAQTLIESTAVKNASFVSWDERDQALDGAALVVNATSMGMQGNPSLDLNLAALPTTAVVNDIVYAPLQTPLLAAAAARSNPSVDGLGMLLYQAVHGFEAWFGVRPDVTKELREFVLA
jgi:shikimate dehydrogenase